MMRFKDSGHYYVDGVLIDGMTMPKCRDQGGIPSVTTKIASWINPNLMFWKIGENVEAAYNVAGQAIGMQLHEYRKMVADEYYRTHPEARIGTFIHEILDLLIKNGIESRLFMDFYREYCHQSISELFESVQMAYEWYKLHIEQGTSEKIIYDEKLKIAGLCDVSGLLINDDGEKVIGGVDWKCSYPKKHPGYRKDGVMKSLGFSKQVDYMLQLGAYGRVMNWEAAYIVKVSTNPLVPGIQPMYYDKESLVKGYSAYGHIARAYDIINGF